MSDNPFKDYKRATIELGTQTIAVLHIFKVDMPLEDIWVSEAIDEVECEKNKDNRDYSYRDGYKRAAKQFIDQMEGNYCVAFMEALRDECDRIVKKHEEYVKRIKEDEEEH